MSIIPEKPPDSEEDETPSEELVLPNAVFKDRWEVVYKFKLIRLST